MALELGHPHPTFIIRHFVAAGQSPSKVSHPRSGGKFPGLKESTKRKKTNWRQAEHLSGAQIHDGVWKAFCLFLGSLTFCNISFRVLFICAFNGDGSTYKKQEGAFVCFTTDRAISVVSVVVVVVSASCITCWLPLQLIKPIDIEHIEIHQGNMRWIMAFPAHIIDAEQTWKVRKWKKIAQNRTNGVREWLSSRQKCPVGHLHLDELHYTMFSCPSSMSACVGDGDHWRFVTCGPIW